MPKFVTDNHGANGIAHLYPAESCESCDGCGRGESHAEGPAYCGATLDSGKSDLVVSPTEMYGKKVFPLFVPGDKKLERACPACAALVQSGALTDPVWQKRFREGVLTDA